MPAKLYQKLPLPVRALQFDNPDNPENVQDLIDFTDDRFRVREAGSSIITAEVYDHLHDTWVGVKNGDFIIRGIEGEFYPHDGKLFPSAYTEVWSA